MICRECAAETQVLETRGDRRRRACPNGHRFTTDEIDRRDLYLLRQDSAKLNAVRLLIAATPEPEEDTRPSTL